MGPSHQTHLIKTITPGERKSRRPDLLHDRTNHEYTHVLNTPPFRSVYMQLHISLSLFEHNSLPEIAASQYGTALVEERKTIMYCLTPRGHVEADRLQKMS